MTSIAIPPEFYEHEEFIDFTTTPFSLKDGAPKPLVKAYKEFQETYDACQTIVEPTNRKKKVAKRKKSS